jgi:NAD-dependent SIR2 family protein deacetylase
MLPGANPDLTALYAGAARLIGQADGLVICAGAGIGVDSGLPDFRGPGGFWQAYPALGRARIRFEEIASPEAFRRDPRLAWGFYGHRLRLYRETVPHGGFALLLALAGRVRRGGFVFTSNVDGQFQRAGFAESDIVECHGSIHHLQCTEPCSDAIWSADGLVPEVDLENCRIVSDLPSCPRCGGLARPAILMFNDWDWAEHRTRGQIERLNRWRDRTQRPVAIEIGAGDAVATVRAFAEGLGAPLIRINPRQWQVARESDIGIAVGALQGIAGILAALGSEHPEGSG